MESYEDRIRSFSPFSIDDCIHVSQVLLREEFRSKPWQILEHGMKLLETEQQLCAYIAAYGEMHKVKCMAAIQNFPFNELVVPFEIVDWGCGQGLASLVLMDKLREREKLFLIAKCTLIEPSMPALQRACINVRKAGPPNMLIEQYNSFLPGKPDTPNVISNLSFSKPITIHLFSNILDIASIDIQALSKLIYSSGKKHYVLCMGPVNKNCNRIDIFCNYFQPNDFFSNLSEPIYGYTSNTGHPYSCKTKCFQFNTNTFIPVVPSSHTETTILSPDECYLSYDEYESLSEQLSGFIDKNVLDLYKLFKNALSNQDRIYIRPDMEGDIPDLLIVRPRIGILVVDVYEPNKQTGPESDKDLHFKAEEIRQNLINIHIKDLLPKSIEYASYWYMIKALTVITDDTTEKIKSYLKKGEKEERKNISYIYTLKSLSEEGKISTLLSEVFQRDSSFYNFSFFHSLWKKLSPGWHSYRMGRNLHLTKEQRDLAKSQSGVRQKIHGVAGSGKTQVLVCRAVNAQIRTGKRVLILTFNLTLINYLRKRMDEIPADFNWSKFYIVNYHQFLRIQAIKYRIPLDLAMFNESDLFESVKDKIEKFDVILVDEIQDYKQVWITNIVKYFLAEKGEFVVFGDKKQDIYHHSEIDKTDDKGATSIHITGIKGGWISKLNKGFRFSTTALTDLAMKFQHFSAWECEQIISQPLLDPDPAMIKYANVGREITVEKLADYSCQVYRKFHLDTNETIILAESLDLLKDLEEILRNTMHQETVKTFETNKQYHLLAGKYSNSWKFERELTNLRRNKKLSFSMQTAGLKLSTIHSFKGWEARNVILIIQPIKLTEENDKNSHQSLKEKYAVEDEQMSHEMIYTAITRAKKNLFIFNMGCEKYHEFFVSAIIKAKSS